MAVEKKEKNKVIVEYLYIVGYDDDTGVHIFLREQAKEPKSPLILYAGGAYALFYRQEGQSILLDELADEIRDPLKEAKEVTIHELKEGSDTPVREYKARMNHVKKIPIDEETLNYPEKEALENMSDEEFMEIFETEVQKYLEKHPIPSGSKK